MKGFMSVSTWDRGLTCVYSRKGVNLCLIGEGVSLCLFVCGEGKPWVYKGKWGYLGFIWGNGLYYVYFKIVFIWVYLGKGFYLGLFGEMCYL